MSTDLDEIVCRLPKLTAAELREIKQRIAALQALGSAPMAVNSVEDINERWVVSTICDTMGALGINSYVNIILGDRMSVRLLRERLPELIKYLDQFGSLRTVKQSALSLCVRLLAENLRDMHVVTDARTIIRNLDRIPAVVDRAFPGYAHAGLLSVIIRKRLST